ncbi:hypothetical protein GQ457_08G019690 [Hibiscus cannabinus]
MRWDAPITSDIRFGVRKNKQLWLDWSPINTVFSHAHANARGWKWWWQHFNPKQERKKKYHRLHQPGIEPGSVPWQGTVLPLDHWCFFLVSDTPINMKTPQPQIPSLLVPTLPISSLILSSKP